MASTASSPPALRAVRTLVARGGGTHYLQQRPRRLAEAVAWLLRIPSRRSLKGRCEQHAHAPPIGCTGLGRCRATMAMRGLTVFISDLRNCSTKEQEEKRVEKEMAHIRSKFRSDSNMNGYNRKKIRVEDPLHVHARLRGRLWAHGGGQTHLEPALLREECGLRVVRTHAARGRRAAPTLHQLDPR